MTRIDFYVLQSAELKQQYNFICRLAEKAYRLGHTVYIHANDEQHAKELDDTLWSFRQNSFVPHSILGAELSQKNPVKIEIGFGEDPNDHHDVMINASSVVPSFFSRFQRISEVVVQEASVKKSTREHYKFYRDRGYPLQSHDLN